MKLLLPPWLTSGLVIILSGASLAQAGTFVPPANNRVDVNFNADWLYVQGDVSGAQAQAFNDSGWTSVGLPHTTKFVTPENPTAYLGVSWYRKHFTVSSNYQGRKVFIEFGAAMQTADVYINGTLAVHHDGGYTPFTADATALVNYGGADNVIAVRIDSTPNGNIPPGNSNPDFQYHGGLYRDVKLHIADPLHVTDAVPAPKQWRPICNFRRRRTNPPGCPDAPQGTGSRQGDETEKACAAL